MMYLLTKHRSAFFYGGALALVLLRCLQWQWVILGSSLELYTGSIAILFTLFGIWICLQYMKGPRVKTEARSSFLVSQGNVISSAKRNSSIPQLQLSKREVEVLDLMAKGLTNQEIAERLFVSVNTVKTHSSRLFEKMGVSRRTQAIDKAKKLHIIE